MLHPSYTDLMEIANENVENGEEPIVASRYSIVMATAKRARQIVNGDEPYVESEKGDKPLSLAVEELYSSKIKILSEEEYQQALREASEFSDIEIVDFSDEEDEALDEAPQESASDETAPEKETCGTLDEPAEGDAADEAAFDAADDGVLD